MAIQSGSDYVMGDTAGQPSVEGRQAAFQRQCVPSLARRHATECYATPGLHYRKLGCASGTKNKGPKKKTSPLRRSWCNSVFATLSLSLSLFETVLDKFRSLDFEPSEIGSSDVKQKPKSSVQLHSPPFPICCQHLFRPERKSCKHGPQSHLFSPAPQRRGDREKDSATCSIPNLPSLSTPDTGHLLFMLISVYSSLWVTYCQQV
ncbi:uncharacterized protein NPIL_429281 [Nephila pilipes]|uniref:Uncharacterized protein n=1 Tax=Nephila pilipes TaxID=299642 RepID=A0A8X6UE98_NEPPI|nr:uncharacterized protein NPIL_429281 [Nephila pilipes]